MRRVGIRIDPLSPALSSPPFFCFCTITVILVELAAYVAILLTSSMFCRVHLTTFCWLLSYSARK
jgi:hypothetical protein